MEIGNSFRAISPFVTMFFNNCVKVSLCVGHGERDTLHCYQCFTLSVYLMVQIWKHYGKNWNCSYWTLWEKLKLLLLKIMGKTEIAHIEHSVPFSCRFQIVSTADRFNTHLTLSHIHTYMYIHMLTHKHTTFDNNLPNGVNCS